MEFYKALFLFTQNRIFLHKGVKFMQSCDRHARGSVNLAQAYRDCTTENFYDHVPKDILCNCVRKVGHEKSKSTRKRTLRMQIHKICVNSDID